MFQQGQWRRRNHRDSKTQKMSPKMRNLMLLMNFSHLSCCSVPPFSFIIFLLILNKVL